MRIKLDQGTLPRLMNRSLNCQNPKTRPRCCHSFLHSGYLLGPFRSRGERCPAPAPTSAGSPQIGQKGSPSSSICTSPETALPAGEEARLPRNVHADGFIFYVKTCVSVDCRRLQQPQEHGCEAGPPPSILEIKTVKAPLPSTPGQVFFKRTFPRKKNPLISCYSCGPGQCHWAGGFDCFSGEFQLPLKGSAVLIFKHTHPRSFKCIGPSSGAVCIVGLSYCVSFSFALEGDKAIIQPIFLDI